jgi:malate dehydrogenase (oxaloacetate-decarboxylating)
MDFAKISIAEHKKHRGKFSVKSKMPVTNRRELSLAYTPGVGAVAAAIAKNPKLADELTPRRNMVAVVSDGSATLGLGNTGPLAATPVMEGKAVLFKEFADIDAVHILLATQDVHEIVETVKNIAPTFGGINLEDISAPRCFVIEDKLSKLLDIPVFHDDQHGTAIVVLAALRNALKVTGKNLKSAKIVINGSGAAGTAVTKLLHAAGARNLLILDSEGIVARQRKNLNEWKKQLLKITNPQNLAGDLNFAMKGADVFVGLSKPNIVTTQMVRSMNHKSIVFALANPVPEIMPDMATSAGAYVVATGRSDFPNQINNVLVFPGFFRGLLDFRITKVTTEMKLNAAKVLAGLTSKPSVTNIIPAVFDKKVAKSIALSLRKFQ